MSSDVLGVILIYRCSDRASKNNLLVLLRELRERGTTEVFTNTAANQHRR